MSPNDPTAIPNPSDEFPRTKEVFDQAKTDLRSHLSDVKDAAGHATDEVQAAAASAAAAARDGYHAFRQDAATQYAGHREDLACLIREQPLKSVAIAALGGIVLGLLVRN